MLRSLYVLLDYHLAASDGVQGTVQDFLFDDESWIVHYLVAETASHMGKRKALILPFAAGRPDWERKRLPLQLTCEQIRTSPPLEADMPISRQNETGVKRPGSHLRSMREVLGYSIHTPDGEAGTIEDFVVEDVLWGVHHAIIQLLKPSQRSIVISPEALRSISWTAKAAWINMSLEKLKQNPDFDPAKPVNKDRNQQIYDYYGRPVHLPPPTSAEQRSEA